MPERQKQPGVSQESEPTSAEILRKHRQPPKSRLRRRIFRGVLIIILLLVAWVGFSAYRAMNKISDGGFSAKDLMRLISGNSDSLKGQSEGRTNIALLGYGGKGNPGGLLADTNILLSYHYSDKKVALVSLPRDLYVPIGSTGSSNKLNYAYAYGEANAKQTGGGGNVSSETISKVSGVPVHYYISMDFVGFVKLVDTLGGVTVDVEKSINDPLYPDDKIDTVQGTYSKTDGYKPFRLLSGVQKLDGVTALKFARSRETTSDFDRARRQQVLLEAIKEKAMSAGVLSNPKKVVDIINILGNHLRTNMSAGEMEALVGLSKEIDGSNITNKVLDNTKDGLLTDGSSGETGYYLKPRAGNFNEIQSLIKNIFNDASATQASSKTSASSSVSTTASSKATGKIEIQNATGVTGKAKDLSKVLAKNGLTIAGLLTATEDQATTVLYDYTAGKNEASVDAIKAALKGVDVKVIKRTDGAGSLDFKLILGEDSAGV
jgi:LCP family protein required for cell wall assembly